MKIRPIITIMLFMAVFSLLAPGGAWGVNVVVDGRRIKLDQPVLTKGGMVFVPLRGIFEKLGASVTYEKSTKTIYAYRKKTNVEIVLDKPYAKIDGSGTRMLRPAFELNGRAYVPLRFISESLGCQVGWHPPSNTVAISSKAGRDPFEGVDMGEMERISIEEKKKAAAEGKHKYDPLQYLMNQQEKARAQHEKEKKKGKIEKIKPGIKSGIKPIKPIDPDKPDDNKDDDDPDKDEDL